MKNLLLITFLISTTFFSGLAQFPGNGNDWVEYGKFYYKFSISEDGIYRLKKSDLQAAGFSAAELVGSDFQMFRNGEEVPLFVSTNGTFSNSDYLEFYGRKNRGDVDSYLYDEAYMHPNPNRSFFTNESIHFLTLSVGQHLRFSPLSNDLTNLPAKEEYFYKDITAGFNNYNPGKYFTIAGTNISESLYQDGEGYVYRLTPNRTSPVFNMPTKDAITTGSLDVYLKFNSTPQAAPNFNSDMTALPKLGNSPFGSITYEGAFKTAHLEYTFDNQYLSNSSTPLEIKNAAGGPAILLGESQLSYPRGFDFSGELFSEMNLNKSGSRYIELKNLSGSSLTIYDLSSLQRIRTSVQPITKIKTGSISPKNNLIWDTDLQTPEFINRVSFQDFTSQTSDVLLIFNSKLAVPFAGENYVDKWIAHKESSIGGNHNVLKINIDQLFDQYAYGISNNPAAIKNLILELNDLGKLPKFVVLFGKGFENNLLQNDPSLLTNQLVPTFGLPGSDSQLVSPYGISKPLCAVGRIAAKSPQELKNFVDKEIAFETLINDTSDQAQTKANKLWMKRSLHLGGGKNIGEQNLFRYYLNRYKQEFENPSMGGKVYSFFKSSTDPIQEIEDDNITELMNGGLALINYFGHSGPGALEFKFNDPAAYNNVGKYPFMLTNGCYVGDLFQPNESLSEIFVLAENGGTLSFMGPSQFGIAQGMNSVCDKFYDQITHDAYGVPIGTAIYSALNSQSENSVIARTTMQQLIYHGDPTLSIYAHEKPDYLVESDDVIFNPNVITSDVDNFEVKVVVSNIGNAQNEDVLVRLTRILPTGEEQVFDQTISNLYYQDTITFNIVTNALVNAGENKFLVEIDPDSSLDEITRANNQLLDPKIRAITSNEVKPIYLSEFAITNNSDLNLIASTQEFYEENRQFEFQIDTTELFNSSELVSEILENKGGTMSWKPSISYQNEQVYYWRVRVVGDDADWSNSSFVFINDYDYGWNQSHYYQFLKDKYNGIELRDSRNFEFGPLVITGDVTTAMSEVLEGGFIQYALQGVVQEKNWCADDPNVGLAVAIFNKNTGVPWKNRRVSAGVGRFNSVYCNSASEYAFYYRINSASSRKDFMNLIDLVGDETYILIYSTNHLRPVEFDWASDATTTGYTIFDKLIENGAQMTNQIKEDTPYVLFFQKGNSNFDGFLEALGADSSVILGETFQFSIPKSEGTITTPLIGPSKSWDKFEWSWNNSLDNISDGDVASYSIVGINDQGAETILFANKTGAELDLSSIDASQYPYLKIVVKIADGTNYTPIQLDYLRIIYDEVPEIAIDIHELVEKYPLEYDQGQTAEITYKLTNISSTDFDPVLVRYQLTDGTGNQTQEELRYGAIAAGQSIDVTYNMDLTAANFAGNDLLYIDANPDNDQREQIHFNNVALIDLLVNKDSENPFLDVTFDGIHIIDGDLVTDQPLIVITLTDENQYLSLDDFNDFEVYIKAPGQTTETLYTIDSPEITFYPADVSNPNSRNAAVIEFTPNFEPGTYQLRVKATDRSENLSGKNDYLVSFEVTNEDIITQIINYPNPFTTSTKFIAKIIGDAPDNVLIQIFSQNGKLVRELQADAASISLSQGNGYYEVASWDGTDTYGDPVGNGVYFYKISMKRNGEIVEMYNTEQQSEYFHNGIGKLYILR